MYKIGFIGTGNMGGALAVAACKTIGPENVIVTDYLPEKASEFAAKYGCALAKDNNEIASNAEYIVLAVKPNVIRDVAAGMKNSLAANTGSPIVVTIAAGVEIKSISEQVGDIPVIRIMPNTPVAVGQGMILITGPEGTEDAINGFMSIMKDAGDFLNTAEKNFDIMTGVSSCAPAYVYMFIQSLADGAVQVGVPRDQAVMLAAKTVLGSAQMVLETKEHPEKLKDNVCSPGGSTIVGVNALEENNFRYGVAQSIIKATEKNLKLGK